MKKIMEMLQNMKAKNEKKDNKGFSLVELIIVIAIMAILVGIVGTQVLPYINKSKEAKDFQIINSYGTAATTAYSSAAEKVTAVTTVTMDDTPETTNSTEPAKSLATEIQKLTGYEAITTDTKTNLHDKMGSKKGQSIAKIVIVINPTDSDSAAGVKPEAAKKTIVTQAYDSSNKPIFDPVVTQL